MTKTKKKWHLKKKYKFLLLLIVIVSITTLWSRYVSTSGLIVKEYKVVSSNLPTSFEGLKIVHFTDIHYGRTVDKNKLAYMVSEINTLKPDLIFLTGDLLDRDIKLTDKIKNEIITTLSKLNATIGKYAITGNHDLEFKEYSDLIQNSGFTNLSNKYDIIYSKNYETIYISGLESEVKGHPNINSITEYLNVKPPVEGEEVKESNIPSYKILLLHTPDTVDKVINYNFDLVLAGHSHNGQIRIPFIGAIAKPVGAKKYYDEYYKINNTDLYISSGVGTSNINFRFFNKPSFNFYRLLKK